jgi:hypothetical protein
MGNNIEGIDNPTLITEKDNFWEKYYIEKLEDSIIPWETNFYLKELKELAKLSDKPNYISKIKGCLNIVQNPDKDIKIREIIVGKLGEDFIPSIDEDELCEKNIRDISNQLGYIIDKHKPEDSFKEKCKETLVETIALRERIYNANEAI